MGTSGGGFDTGGDWLATSLGASAGRASVTGAGGGGGAGGGSAWQATATVRNALLRSTVTNRAMVASSPVSHAPRRGFDQRIVRTGRGQRVRSLGRARCCGARSLVPRALARDRRASRVRARRGLLLPCRARVRGVARRLE